MIALIAKDFGHRIRFSRCERTYIWRKLFLCDEKATFSSSFKVVVDYHFHLKSLLNKFLKL